MNCSAHTITLGEEVCCFWCVVWWTLDCGGEGTANPVVDKAEEEARGAAVAKRRRRW